ncbi:MAG: GNAT family N-acetyltransferase [Defluviitaleaceae bacterium]|nr:GNAT family N-acetyltransferase [Defluviitaleaceae bacterium]
MQVTINGSVYDFVKSPIRDNLYREGYFNLIEKVFGLSFVPWYESGFCGDSFIPYTLFSDGAAVASVGVVINNFNFNGAPKRYIQISTVATDNEYRKQGLSRWLAETVLKEWKDSCDCIYLYANDSVAKFYPKFGFIPMDEHRYHMPISRKDGLYRKLDISNKRDVKLLVEMHTKSNPFSLLAIDRGVELMMFHCITFLYDNIYYLEEHDAIVIADHENNDMFCYDIYGKGHCNINDLLGIVAKDSTTDVTLGFTPKDARGYTIEKANEEDTTVFVLGGKEALLADKKITLPFLSRA